MKSPFKHREAIQLAHDMEHNNTYTNALIAENKRLQFQVSQTRYSAAEMLDAACEIADENKRLRGEVVELRAERDALAKSSRIVSEPIETIQPRGIVE